MYYKMLLDVILQTWNSMIYRGVVVEFYRTRVVT